MTPEENRERHRIADWLKRGGHIELAKQIEAGAHTGPVVSTPIKAIEKPLKKPLKYSAELGCLLEDPTAP